MSILLSALGGGAGALLEDMNSKRDASQRQDAMRLSADLDADKAKTLALFQQQMKEAPLQRLQEKAKGYANEELPVASTPVTGLTGVYASEDGPSDNGFKGNIAGIKKSIDQLPEGRDKEAALAQLMAQVDDAQAASDQGIVGKTRKRSSDEAFDLALNDAKTSDIAAYAAGRPLSTEKMITVADGATVIDKSGKVLYDGSGSKEAREAARAEAAERRLDKSEEGRDRRQAAMLAAQEKLAAMRAGGGASGGTSKEERLRYTSLFNEAGRRMNDVQKAINTLRRDPMYSMAKPGSAQANELKDLQDQMREYKQEREMFGQLLAGSQTGGESKPDTKPDTKSNDPLGLFSK